MLFTARLLVPSSTLIRREVKKANMIHTCTDPSSLSYVNFQFPNQQARYLPVYPGISCVQVSTSWDPFLQICFSGPVVPEVGGGVGFVARVRVRVRVHFSSLLAQKYPRGKFEKTVGTRRKLEHVVNSNSTKRRTCEENEEMRNGPELKRSPLIGQRKLEF